MSTEGLKNLISYIISIMLVAAKAFLLPILLMVQWNLCGLTYDCFIFFNEIELLAIRLEELDPVVDYFVLVEGTQTFTGESKPLFFSENRHLFESYLHKIIHVIVDDYPFIGERVLLHRQAWIREIHQRNAILRGLTYAADEDIVTITDADEIPRREAILSAKERFALPDSPSAAALEMPLFRYQLNRWQPAGFWRMGLITTRKALHQKLPHSMRMRNQPDFIPNAGWHFTSQGGIDRVLYKLKSDSHAYDMGKVLQQRIIQDFDQVLNQLIVVPIDDTWPIRIRRLEAEYSALGWIAH